MGTETITETCTPLRRKSSQPRHVDSTVVLLGRHANGRDLLAGGMSCGESMCLLSNRDTAGDLALLIKYDSST